MARVWSFHRMSKSRRPAPLAARPRAEPARPPTLAIVVAKSRASDGCLQVTEFARVTTLPAAGDDATALLQIVAELSRKVKYPARPANALNLTAAVLQPRLTWVNSDPEAKSAGFSPLGRLHAPIYSQNKAFGPRVFDIHETCSLSMLDNRRPVRKQYSFQRRIMGLNFLESKANLGAFTPAADLWVRRPQCLLNLLTRPPIRWTWPSAPRSGSVEGRSACRKRRLPNSAA